MPDDLADGWDDMVRRNQALQATNEPGVEQQVAPQDATAIGDGLPVADWMAQRTQEIADALNPPPAAADDSDDRVISGQGVDSLEAAAGDDIVRTPPAGPLTGRTPMASSVANAVDAVAAGPNTSAPVHNAYFNGTLQRGAGGDVHLHGDLPKLFLKGVDVSGVLEGPDAQGGIRVSGLKGSGLPLFTRLPPRLRLYNLPDGELDVDLGGPVKFGPFAGLKAGSYAIR